MYNNYCKYITTILNDNIEDLDFKSNQIYRVILEHVSKELGDEYLSVIQDKFSDIYNKNFSYITALCKINDYIGKPEIYQFDNFTKCSPSNLRYILHSLLILSYMDKNKLNDIDIIEIGGGYGGLCFYLYKLSHMFNININTYTIYDLPKPLLLQKKYLNYYNITNVNFNYISDTENLKNGSFLISNYAFSEIPIVLQNIYSKNIINPYTSYGFLCWNHIDVYNFVDNKNITVEPEVPLTGNNNKYVYYSPL